MKKTISIIPVLLLILIFACKKEEPQEEKEINGEAKCVYNGSLWIADNAAASALKNNRDTFKIGFSKSINGIRNGSIRFGTLIKTTEKQYVKRINVNYDTLPYGWYVTNDIEEDAMCDTYYPIESDSINNWIHITKQENDYQEMWGEFSISLYKESGCDGSPYPDTVIVRSGTFHIWKVNYW